MTPAQQTGMSRALRAVIRSGAPADREDLAQEAYVIALEASPRCTNDNTAAAYIGKIVRRQLHNAVGRWVAVVTLPHYQLRHAHRYAQRVEYNDDLFSCWGTPEDLVGDVEIAHQVRAEMGRVLSRLNMDRFGASRHAARRARLKLYAKARRHGPLRELWALLRGGH